MKMIIAAREKGFDRLLKAGNLDLYYENIYIKYYYFYQKCKNFFKIVQAKSYIYVFFVALYLKAKIFFCSQQHKIKIKHNIIALLIQDKFKIFLRKNFKKSTVFIDGIQSKIREDF